MTNDAKLGLVVGIGLVVLIAIVFFRKDPLVAQVAPAPAQTASVTAPAPSEPLAVSSPPAAPRTASPVDPAPLQTIPPPR
jgi:hypothetical protein